MTDNKIEIKLKDGATLKDAIDKLISIYGDELKNRIYDSENQSYIIEFIVNQKRELPLKILEDGDEIAIVPFVAGG